MQKQSFHASLTSNIHPCSGYTPPTKCLKKAINKHHHIWELSQTTPKKWEPGFPYMILSIQPWGVVSEWGVYFWEFLGYSLYHSPPLLRPSPPFTKLDGGDEVVGTFISCSSLRRAVKSERKAAVLGARTSSALEYHGSVRCDCHCECLVEGIIQQEAIWKLI